MSLFSDWFYTQTVFGTIVKKCRRKTVRLYGARLNLCSQTVLYRVGLHNILNVKKMLKIALKDSIKFFARCKHFEPINLTITQLGKKKYYLVFFLEALHRKSKSL